MKAETKQPGLPNPANEESMFSIMTMYYNDLFRYGIKFTADVDLTKDVLGQFFLHIYEKREKVLSAENIKAYLVVSFKRFLIQHLQNISRELKLTVQESNCFEYAYEDYLIAWQDDEQKKASLQKAIASLSNRQKELLQLRFYEQMSYEDIADKTSLSLRTVYNKLHEGLKRLRSHPLLETIRKNRSFLLNIFPFSLYVL